MPERRRFSGRERTALYLAADGRCSRCGVELTLGWHADHVDPHSRGGPTDVVNGQALCPDCNLKKGARVTYADRFQPRPFQQEVIRAVLDGIASGRSTTIGLAAPGSGKTLAYQAATTFAYRESRLDYVAAFVPRIILAQQCETSWRHSCPTGHCKPDRRDATTGLGGYHVLFSPSGRLGAVRHIRNSTPLLPPGERGIGFVTTYAALVGNPDIYESWARQHAGRFLLVADEAQFCGVSNDERSGGTQAGARMEGLSEYAAHTLLLTGTAYRSDGQRLILSDYDEPDEKGRRRLLCDVEASYSDGIAEGYLRPFEFTMHDVNVRWKSVAGPVFEYQISASGEDLAEVLRRPEVWQPLTENVVTAVREKQSVHRDYRGLISCMEQKDAKKVHAYLTVRFPELRVKLAISDDGSEAERALREFQAEPSDILVTVRKAFIGYDCPEITVIGVLTHYRDRGHLMQLVGRGLRMWDEAPRRQQSCRVIAPDDPAMDDFLKLMRGESEEGLRERARRERDTDRSPLGDDDELGYVESAFAVSARAVSNDAELDNDDRVLYEAVKHDLGIVDDVTKLAKFLDVMGLRSPNPAAETTPQVPDEPPPPTAASAPLTELEQIGEINSKTAAAIRSFLASIGIRAGEPSYEKHIAQWTANVNSITYKAGEVRTVEQAEARLRAAIGLRK